MKFRDYIKEDVFDAFARVKSGNKKATVSFMISAKNEKDAEKQYKEKLTLHIKNGHLPKDSKIISDIKFK